MRTGHARALHASVPPADRRATRRTGARGWRCRATCAQRAAARGARTAVRRARRRTRTRSASTRQSGARSAQLRHPAALVDRYGELTRARRVLSRPARLHALPLPQHRAAVAMPALPRLEYVRRGADRPGAGREVSGWKSAVQRTSGNPTCARRFRAYAAVGPDRRSRRARAFSVGRPSARRAAARSLRARSGPARPAAASCISGGQTVDDHRVEVAAVRPSRKQRDVDDRQRRAADQFERAQARGDRAIDRRVNDRFEVAARLGSANTMRPSLRRSTRAVRLQDLGAEARRDRRCRFRAGGRDAVRELVGVEAGYAALLRTAAARSSCRWRCRRSAPPSAWQLDADRRCRLQIQQLAHRLGSDLSCHASQFRGRDRVLQQHRDRQRADAAGHRRQRAGHLFDRRGARRRATSAPRRSNASRRFDPGGKRRSTSARSVTRLCRRRRPSRRA